MRVLLVIAAVVISFVAVPADAATRRAGAPRAAPKDACAKAAAKRPARAGRHGARRRCAASRRALVGLASPGLIGAPGSFAAPAPFATAPTAAPGAAPSGPAPEAPAPPVLPPVYSNPRALQVRAYEFRFQLSKSVVAAGDVRVEFNLSAAEDPHNLFLVREDGTGSAHSFGEEPSGAVVAKTVPLTAGRWTLLCSLTGHEAAGMRAALTVG